MCSFYLANLLFYGHHGLRQDQQKISEDCCKNILYRLAAFPDAQPTASKHWRQDHEHTAVQLHDTTRLNISYLHVKNAGNAKCTANAFETQCSNCLVVAVLKTDTECSQQWRPRQLNTPHTYAMHHITLLQCPGTGNDSQISDTIQLKRMTISMYTRQREADNKINKIQ